MKNLLNKKEIPSTASTSYTVVATDADGNVKTKIVEKGVEKEVDLGLPSGRIWATCNVGATKPEEYGLYFAWGAIEGCGSDTSDGKTFEWPSAYDAQKGYPHSDDIPEVLDAEYDAATVNMGGDWHMPDSADIDELLANTTSVWTTVNGVNGRLFTSKTNGKTMFIPAAGFRDGSILDYASQISYVWSREVFVDDDDFAWSIYFASDEYDRSFLSRYTGLPVRGVK